MSADKPGKKRSRSAVEQTELEIDVNADEPLSKRAARRLKKGRSLKQASSGSTLPDSFQDAEEQDEQNQDDESSPQDATIDRKKQKNKTKPDEKEYVKGTNGIWIGNLSFRTTEADLRTFFTTCRPLGKAKPTSSYHVIGADDVVRISLPVAERGNKGFAYLDFASPEALETALALSERILGGRNVLIKPADNFDGRPKPADGETKEQQQQPKEGTKILYIGNLSFDVTDKDLESFLGGTEAGIKKVRMATFEDSGKCKGFAFIDFTSIDHVRKILKDKKLHSMNGRKLKMEFGQDRSLRRKPPAHTNGETVDSRGGAARAGGGRMAGEKKIDARTIKPGKALMDAPRASHAIVASQGEKVSFD